MGIIISAGKSSSLYLPGIASSTMIPLSIRGFVAAEIEIVQGISVSGSLPLLYSIDTSSDAELVQGIKVSSNFSFMYSIKLGVDIECIWRIAFCINDLLIPYSLRYSVYEKHQFLYTLAPLITFNHTASIFGLHVSNTISMTYSISELIKTNINMSYNIVTFNHNTNHINYNITTINKVANNYSFIYTLYDPVSETINTTVEVFVNDILIDTDSIQMEIDEDSYCWSVQIQLANMDAFMLASPGNDLRVIIGSTEYVFIIDSRNRFHSWGDNTYLINARSSTSTLGYGAVPIYKTWDSISAYDAIVELTGGIPVDFQLTNWIFPDGVLSSEGELPIEIINKIVKAAGGILITKNDGSLFVQYKYKQAPPLFNIGNVDFTISDLNDIFLLSEERTTKPCYNQVYVSNEPDVDSVFMQLEEVYVDKITLTALIRAFVYPFISILDLFQSYDNTVHIVPQNNPIIEEMPEELIEIIDGSGNVTYPIYSIIENEYLKRDLGLISYTNNNITTEIVGNSLLRLKYESQYHDFLVDTNTAKKVQVYTED